MDSSVLDQLRLQDGRLFQSESILALFLDAKAVALEAFTRALRSENKEEALTKLIVLDDDDTYELALKSLAPSGIEDYHAKALHECVKISANLLWPTEIFLVARPKLSTLMKGLFKRLFATDCIRTSEFLSLDPIKQDFVIRESFRRTLVNDCLVVFDAPAKDFNELVDSGNTDSKRPKSTLGPVEDDDLDGSASTYDDNKSAVSAAHSVAQSEARSASKHVQEQVIEQADMKSVAQSVARSVARSVAGSVARSVAPSVAPRIVPTGSIVSAASQATGVSMTSVRTPTNVRKVKIEPEL